LPSAEKLTYPSPCCDPAWQISPGAKTLAIGPGVVCPKYGPTANGFANAGIEPTAQKATSQTIFFLVCFITNLPLLTIELVSNMIIPQKEFCFARKLYEMNKEVT
jgi:hypothetical protein